MSNTAQEILLNALALELTERKDVILIVSVAHPHRKPDHWRNRL